MTRSHDRGDDDAPPSRTVDTPFHGNETADAVDPDRVNARPPEREDPPAEPRSDPSGASSEQNTDS